MAVSGASTPSTKLTPETTAQFLSISHDFLGLVNEYQTTSPDDNPHHYIAIVNSLLHFIRDLETILHGVRDEVQETRLINNQAISP
ncbi:MAG: hypothetical protein ACFFFG_01470 [Candidatus Thorarchaeota archaeon]